jgi:hypothetical protein
MEWIIARLREDTTRAAIGQMGIAILLVCLLLGVDVGALLTQAEASMDRIVALLGAGLAVSAQLSRIVSVEAPKAPPGPAPDVTVAMLAGAIETIAKTRVYEDGRLQNGISVEMIGAIDAARTLAKAVIKS